MAIITVSRQLASGGDEVSRKIAERLGYKFFGKKELERRIVDLGFPETKLARFDEKKVGFLAGLTRSRDEYLNYLMTAILEAAAENNCVIVGRGSFIILKDLENHISCRFIADDAVRIERLQNEMSCNKKSAVKKINETESIQKNFYKSFFNFDIHEPTMFDVLLNTTKLDADALSSSIATLCQEHVTEQKNAAGQQKIDELLIGQRIVDILIFLYNLDITYLRTSINGNKLTLHGIADNQSVVDSALTIVEAELPSYQIESAINVTQDFKAYR
ncbi:MAG: cytidylate kinase-like family protein [Treponema sp.]|nr:cytidylate kinase-like family protein [Treponema sp.]